MILHVYTRLEIDWLPTILDVCSTKNSICTSSSILVILIRNICLVINYSVETDQSATNISVVDSSTLMVVEFITLVRFSMVGRIQLVLLLLFTI